MSANSSFSYCPICSASCIHYTSFFTRISQFFPVRDICLLIHSFQTLATVKVIRSRPRTSDWAREATEWAKQNGVFTGDSAGNFGWQQPITREAAAKLLYEYHLMQKE